MKDEGIYGIQCCRDEDEPNDGAHYSQIANHAEIFKEQGFS